MQQNSKSRGARAPLKWRGRRKLLGGVGNTEFESSADGRGADTCGVITWFVVVKLPIESSKTHVHLQEESDGEVTEE